MENLTIAQAARELHLTEDTVRKYCQAGRLGQKFGRQWLITREELDTFKEQRRPPGRPRKDEVPPA